LYPDTSGLPAIPPNRDCTFLFQQRAKEGIRMCRYPNRERKPCAPTSLSLSLSVSLPL